MYVVNTEVKIEVQKYYNSIGRTEFVMNVLREN